MLSGVLGAQVQEYVVRDAEVNSFILLLLSLRPPGSNLCQPQSKEAAPHSSNSSVLSTYRTLHREGRKQPYFYTEVKLCVIRTCSHPQKGG